jgi:hypothetical protein
MNAESGRSLQFTCPECGSTKEANQFPRNRSTKTGYGTYCKPCHNNAIGKRNRERLHGSTRHYHLSRRYGISAAQAEALIEAHGGLCAICRKRPAQHVDHDHCSGSVRGMLCLPCNTGLGHFNDDIADMQRAIDYLKRHRPGDVHEPSTPYILSVA